MKYATLAEVRSYYTVATHASLAWRPVEQAGLERFASAIFEISKLARRLDDETGWREFLYPARRARNIVTTVPLPFSRLGLDLAPLVDELERTLPALRVYGGDETGAIGREIVVAGRELLVVDDAPLLNAVLDTAPPARNYSNAVLLPIPEYVPAVAEHLRSVCGRRDIAVVSCHDMANLDPVDRLLVIGPLYWYRDHQYVLTSPRAPQIVVLKWSWYREHDPPRRSLDGSRGGIGLHVRPPPSPTGSFAVDADEERTRIDWASLSRELAAGAEGEAWEAVPARAAVLAGRCAVLLPEEGDRFIWLLDPQAPSEHRVSRVDIADLEPGDVIVLRTSGGGDLIVPIADELLGDGAQELRDLQRRWKLQLCSWVRQQGSVRSAVRELRKRGCTSANPQNLQNWLGERSLRIEDRHDWQVLMDAASLGADAERIWQAMSKVHSAHIEAGRSIGRRLRELANTSPLDPLLSKGTQIFSLASGGSLTAFRVEGFSPIVTQSPPGHLMIPIQVRDEWLT